MKTILMTALTLFICLETALTAHCQMPCGIYHDDLVFDQIDQYVETMFKDMTMLNDLKVDSSLNRNQFVRWVITKEKCSDEMAQLITTYFLQQKIKPDEEDTAKRLESAHKMLFFLVQIKQNSDRKFVDQFSKEWEKFKLMFHVEGYEYKMEQIKDEKREMQEKEQGNSKNSHTHDDHHHDEAHHH